MSTITTEHLAAAARIRQADLDDTEAAPADVQLCDSLDDDALATLGLLF